MRKEDKFDQFFLKDKYGYILIKMVRRYLPETVTTLLEPSCGAGAILYKLPSIRNDITIIGNDLDSRMSKRCCYHGYKVSNKDFLKHDWSNLGSPKDLAIIGGPPYGTNSKMAIAFFNHAAEYANFIAMVLPGTFARDDFQNRLNPYFHLIKQHVLPEWAFYRPDSGGQANIGSVIQIWMRKSKKRKLYNPETTTDFYFPKVSHVLRNLSLATFAMSRRNLVDVVSVQHAVDDLNTKTNPAKNSKYVFICTEQQQVLDTFNEIDWMAERYPAIIVPSLNRQQITDIYVRYKMKNSS